MDRSVKFSIKQRKPSFFKVLVNQDMSTRLQIPPAFVMKYRKYLSSKIVLKNYQNESWKVEVAKIEESFYFANGWETFVKDNALEFGDFVLFKYSCNSTFKFKIYGTTCCEKEVQKTSEAVNVDKENDAANGEGNIIVIYSGNNDQGGKLKHSMCKQRKKDSMRKRRRKERGVQCDEDVNFNSTNPFFHVKLTSAYASTYIPIPSAFFKKHMKMDEEIKLEVDEKIWSVNLYMNNRKFMNCGQARFTVGWMQFVKENDLKERDVCIFEMIKIDAPHVFRVYIKRG